MIAAVVRAAAVMSYPSGVASARAVSFCVPQPPPVQPLYSGLGVLEAALVDHRGRLFVSSQTWGGLTGAVLRIDHPGAKPEPLVQPVPSPGGLALDPQGNLLIGFGDSVPGGLVGNLVGRAGLLKVDPDNGHRQIWATGLGMANGVACADDGTVFASNDVGDFIDRVRPNGDVERRWARVWSANGLAIDPSGQYLYGARTFTRAALWRLELAKPARVSTYASPAWPAVAALLDGITIDGTGRLYVAANGAGQIWRVDTDGRICALARGLRFPSAVALGRGPEGFHAGALYAVTFNGDIVAVPIGASPTCKGH